MDSKEIIGVITFVIAAFTFFIGATVLLRNTRDKKSRLLFIIATLFSAWMVSNYFSNDTTLSYNTQLIINRLLFVFSTGATGLLPIFLGELTSNNFIKKYNKDIISISAIVMLLDSSRYVVSAIKPVMPVTKVIFGSAGIVYFAWLATVISISIVVFWRGMKNSTGITKSRLRIIGWSSIISLVLVAISNAFLPYAYGWFEASLLGPLFFAIMVIGFAFAIVHQRLFDIRYAIVRSFAYIAAVLTLGIGYFIVVSDGLVRLITDSSSNTEIQRGLNTLAAISLALFYQPTKKMFDKLTVRLFYQDNYDSKKIIGKLTEIITNEVQIDRLSEKNLKLIVDTLHPAHATFLVINNQGCKVIYTQIYKKKYQILKEKCIQEMCKRRKLLLKSSDEISSKLVKKLFAEQDIEVLLKLTTANSVEGLLLLGPKESGIVYNHRDVRLLKLCGKYLGLALANAKRLDEISKFSETLIDTVETATEKLARANKKLKELNITKNAFITAASHQLRPQLTTALGFMDILERSAHRRLKKEEKDLLNLSKRSMQRMNHIVFRILESAKEKIPIIRTEKQKVNLHNIIESEISIIKNQSSKINFVLNVEKGVEKKQVEIDQNMIREVFYNLLKNAVDYSGSGNKVEVTMSLEKEHLVSVAVRDEGIGMSTYDTKKIFDKFYRSKNAKKVRPSGTGIGLFVAKQIVLAHGGNVFINSEKGKGSTIGFTLPLVTKKSK